MLRSMILILLFGFSISLIMAEVFQFFGRDFWLYITTRGGSGSPSLNYFLAYYMTGILKSLLQFNPFTSLNYFFSDYGEHGYDTLFSKSFFYIFVILYFVSLPASLLNFQVLRNHSQLYAYVLLNILVYSSIYGGLTGLRLSFPISILIFYAALAGRNNMVKS